jgi:MFS family permease
LVDRYGPKWIVIVGCFVAAIGSFVFAQAPNLWIAGLGRVLAGLGVSVTFIALLKLIAMWFPARKFASMTGLAILLGNCGALLSTLPLQQLLRWMSWRSVFSIAGLLNGMLGVACIVWLKNRPHKPILMMNVAQIKAPSIGQGMWQVLKNRHTWMPLVICAGLAGSFLAFVGLTAVRYLTQVQHISPTQASAINLCAIAGFGVGSLAMGKIADYLARRKSIIMIAGGVYCLCWLPFLLQIPLGYAMSSVLFALMGLCVSSFTLSWTLAKEVNPVVLAGTATGLVNAGAFLVTGLLQIIVGRMVDAQLIDKALGFHFGLILLASVAVLGWCAAWFCLETKGENCYVSH